ncbi:MAG: phosphoribosylformylglycinamidine synthase subunit PurS [Candidatus Bathyarchaeota archaeon]|nr:MAG: phosphoribosylformylglycinamidine synthase subunit PurS [Candidatus Bathyarchaeota archaeon]
MLYKVRAEISLKPGHSDPEGETTTRSLKELTYPVRNIGVSKMYTITLEAKSRSDAETKVDEMCKRLLANPTKDNYTIQVEQTQ